MRILVVLLLIVPLKSISCDKLIGDYKSVSETHWNFELQITTEKVWLTYTDYEYGYRDLRTDYRVESEGYCENTEAGYRIVFANKTINIEFHKSLSHNSFGGAGESPGITGEFIENQQVKMWQNL